MRRVFLLLHAPIAFWNLFSSPPSSCASELCFAVSCAASSELCSSVSIPPSILTYVGSPVETVWPRESASHNQASYTIPRKCIESASTCMGRSDYVCGQLSLQLGSAAAHRASRVWGPWIIMVRDPGTPGTTCACTSYLHPLQCTLPVEYANSQSWRIQCS